MRESFGRIYAAFNARDVEGALEEMREDVDWPKASEGGRVIGKEAIRQYWRRQWAEFDPRVEPVEVVDGPDGRVTVRVRQVVRAIGGEVLSDHEVVHRYTMVEGKVARMDVEAERPGFGRE